MSAISTKFLPKSGQVFFTYGQADRSFASRVAAALEGAGLKVVAASTVTASGVYDEHVRDAIKSSQAAVVAFSGRSGTEFPSSVLFEIGAAMGAYKPVFVIVEDLSRKLGFSVPDMHVLPISRLDEISQALAEISS